MANGSTVEGAVSSVRVLTMNLWNQHGDWARRRTVLWASDHSGVTAELAVLEET